MRNTISVTHAASPHQGAAIDRLGPGAVVSIGNVPGQSFQYAKSSINPAVDAPSGTDRGGAGGVSMVLT